MIASASVSGKPIAFASAFPTSYGDHGPTHHLFVRVETDDGVWNVLDFERIPTLV